MLSDTDKQYFHCLIKDKYINSNPLIGIEDIKVDSNYKITYDNASEVYFCTFRDKLNRNVVAFTEKINDKYIPKIYQLEYKELIQSYKESSTETVLFYYKGVLDLNDIKDYLFICGFNSSCHIMLLNKNTKLFELKKVIQNNKNHLKVIPNDTLKNNFMILYNIYDSNSNVYELETDNVEKISELEEVANKHYFSFYDYDRVNYKENAYIVECSQDRVRLLYSNKDLKEYKAFNINPKEDKEIHHAIIITNNNDKRLY